MTIAFPDQPGTAALVHGWFGGLGFGKLEQQKSYWEDEFRDCELADL